ncbi:MAG: hypothetical protein ACYSOP_06430, partial [Planctomycetota bacterium]
IWHNFCFKQFSLLSILASDLTAGVIVRRLIGLLDYEVLEIRPNGYRMLLTDFIVDFQKRLCVLIKNRNTDN